MKARLTFPNLYPEGSLGHKNTTARNGHYLEAPTRLELDRKINAFVCQNKQTVDAEIDWPNKNVTLLRVVPVLANHM